ncbi:hypothetical protein ACFQ05_18355 [Amycolatopsis umgeniensis]|uniref:Uncharacterized protein n=1 Tax=Amycolatopsis umgeniensis TaxID=336628 RepID=A0A841BF94_9PSEU|nr:hypothetical protein [Amycolatopsis umgeniensis]
MFSQWTMPPMWHWGHLSRSPVALAESTVDDRRRGTPAGRGTFGTPGKLGQALGAGDLEVVGLLGVRPTAGSTPRW